MMKKTLAVMALAMMTASVGAHAVSLEHCKITIKTNSIAVGLLGEGGIGHGVAECADIYGNSYEESFQVGMVGTGLKAGFCSAETTFYAVGAGFSLHQLIAEIGRAEIGSMLLFRKSVGAAYRVNPLGVSVDLAVTESDYTGLCGGIASVSKMWVVDNGFFNWDWRK